MVSNVWSVIIIPKEWVNKSEMDNTIKKLDQNMKKTKDTVDELVAKGYLKKYWNKKQKDWMFKTTEKGKKWYKGIEKNA